MSLAYAAGSRRAVTLALALSCLAAWIVGDAPRASAVAVDLPTSPAGEVLVVDANVQELIGSDLKDLSELDIFADRLVQTIPNAPDALLLQEVRHQSAAYVARALEQRTGDRFAVAADPGRQLYTEINGKRVATETAVVVNTTTMSVLDPGGFIMSSYPRRVSTGHRRPKIRRHAYVSVQQRSGGSTFALASVHLVKSVLLRSPRIARRYKKRWSVEVANRLATTYGAADENNVHVIGGDFNALRCLRFDGLKCVWVAPFWATLTNDALGYVDALKPYLPGNAIDFIFGSGGSSSGGRDAAYTKELRADPATFYSDHEFRWALVTPSDLLSPTAPDRLRTSSPWSSPARVDLSWRTSTDTGGSGLAGYEVWRSGDGATFVKIGISNSSTYVDKAVNANDQLWYRVVSFDKEGNRSTASNTAQTVVGDD